jgi:hypothetical protein
VYGVVGRGSEGWLGEGIIVKGRGEEGEGTYQEYYRRNKEALNFSIDCT